MRKVGRVLKIIFQGVFHQVMPCVLKDYGIKKPHTLCAIRLELDVKKPSGVGMGENSFQQ